MQLPAITWPSREYGCLTITMERLSSVFQVLAILLELVGGLLICKLCSWFLTPRREDMFIFSMRGIWRLKIDLLDGQLRLETHRRQPCSPARWCWQPWGWGTQTLPPLCCKAGRRAQHVSRNSPFLLPCNIPSLLSFSSCTVILFELRMSQFLSSSLFLHRIYCLKIILLKLKSNVWWKARFNFYTIVYNSWIFWAHINTYNLWIILIFKE